MTRLPATTSLTRPVGIPFGDGAVVVGERPAQDRDTMAGGAGLGLGHADLCQLRARIGDARQRRIVDPRRQAEQRAADHDAGVVGADMGEGARADALRVGDVADRIDAPVGQAAQSAVGGDARPAGPHVAGGQIERLEVRPPADRDQQVAAGDPAAVGQDQGRTWLDRRPHSRPPAA